MQTVCGRTNINEVVRIMGEKYFDHKNLVGDECDFNSITDDVNLLMKKAIVQLTR